MPRTKLTASPTQNKIVMGFWHNWAAEAGQGYRGGRFLEMTLSAIPVQYNVIAVAFMKVLDLNTRIPDFKPYKDSDEAFRQQVDIVHAQGRKVLISLGGADAHIELYAGDETALAERIISLSDKYGFDGLDIDLEQSAITAADNQTVIPAALKVVKDHYRLLGKNFIISMAPEFPYLVQGREYGAYITGLEGYYDYIAPQFYNQGGDGVYVDNVGWLAQNNDAEKADFLYYLTESLVTGTRGFIKIPHDKFIIGLPTNNDAAATGYVIDPQDVYNALARLESAALPVAGLMTWSVNWDAGTGSSGTAYDWEFIRRYGYLAGDGVVPEPQPDEPVPDPDPQPDPDPAPEPDPDDGDYRTWMLNGTYQAGEIVIYQGKTWTALVTHTAYSTDWAPDRAPTLWREVATASSSAGIHLALRHGHIATPESRAYFAWQEGRLNAGQLNQCEAGKFFPATERGLSDIVAPTDTANALPPPDGKIASANQGDGEFLDEPGTHWKKHSVRASEVMTFTWTYTASHTTRRYNYFITRKDWNPSLPLSRAQFEAEPFFRVEFTEQPFWSHTDVLRPAGPTTHNVPLPQRTGYHVLLAVWEVADTGNAFYQVIDLDFTGSVDPGNNEPVAPAGLRASTVSTDSISLAWNASVTAGATCRLYRNESLVYAGAELNFIDSGLQTNTAYRYTISAVSAAGTESARSQPLIVTTSTPAVPGTPPTAPINLHSMAVTATSVTLMWGPSVSSTGLTGYIIYRDGSEVARVPFSQLSLTDSPLQEATTYRYFVVAEDTSGQLSVPGNVLNIVTATGGDDGNDGDYPQWVQNGTYQAGQKVSYLGKVWIALVTHVAYSPDWAPGEAPTLWREVV